ncbi:hypothetical protein EVA_10722, partial [gut metagenome]
YQCGWISKRNNTNDPSIYGLEV